MKRHLRMMDRDCLIFVTRLLPNTCPDISALVLTSGLLVFPDAGKQSGDKLCTDVDPSACYYDC